MVPVVVDDNGCNENEDINFRFTGFTISDRVVGAVSGERCSVKNGGPSNVEVELLSPAGDIISSVLTSSSGSYLFTDIFPVCNIVVGWCRLICRTVSDAANVFEAIAGVDARDNATIKSSYILAICSSGYLQIIRYSPFMPPVLQSLIAVLRFPSSSGTGCRPIFRTASDAANVLEAFADVDAMDKATIKASKYVPKGGYAHFLRKDSLKGRRLGIVRYYRFNDTSLQKTYEQHLNTLRQQGAVLIDNLKIDNVEVIKDAGIKIVHLPNVFVVDLVSDERRIALRSFFCIFGNNFSPRFKILYSFPFTSLLASMGKLAISLHFYIIFMTLPVSSGSFPEIQVDNEFLGCFFYDPFDDHACKQELDLRNHKWGHYFIFGIATCAYIVMQFSKLSYEESLQDPMYYVLLKHPNKCGLPAKSVVGFQQSFG
ncbi:hypothetical protein K1719_029340 [Acacia pycnantha]|nr:hypothetical protein K1719_029340 [Acacia pycnantha]